MTIETTPEQTDSTAAPEPTDTAPARKPFDPWPPLTRDIRRVLAPLGSAASSAIKTVAAQAARELIDGGWDLEAPFPFNLSDHVEFEAALHEALGRGAHTGEGPALQQVIRLHLETERDHARAAQATGVLAL